MNEGRQKQKQRERTKGRDEEMTRNGTGKLKKGK